MTVEGSAVVGFDAWKAGFTFPPGEDGPLDDPDGDGVQNLLEFVTGSNPVEGGPSFLPSSGTHRHPDWRCGGSFKNIPDLPGTGAERPARHHPCPAIRNHFSGFLRLECCPGRRTRGRSVRFRFRADHLLPHRRHRGFGVRKRRSCGSGSLSDALRFTQPSPKPPLRKDRRGAGG